MYPFKTIELPYDFNAFEPYIDEKTMQIHYTKHYATYVKNLNAELEKQPKYQRLTLLQLLSLPVPQSLYNQAGGVFNHELYFTILGQAPLAKDISCINSKVIENANKSIIVEDIINRPTNSLREAIISYYGSIESFKHEFKRIALTVFGSGYAWLLDTPHGLKIEISKNQNVPKNGVPLLNIDVWEHAYYLKMNADRAGYIDNWFHIICEE